MELRPASAMASASSALLLRRTVARKDCGVTDDQSATDGQRDLGRGGGGTRAAADVDDG